LNELDNADAVDADLATIAVDAGSALDKLADLVDANVVRQAVSVSVAVDRGTFFVLAVCWRACWAVRSDKTLGVVEALVALAVRSWSTIGKVLAVGVSGASDIIALVVSAESRRRWPATVLVGSALLFLALITDAEAFAISAFRNVGCARSVSDAFWLVAFVHCFVAKLIRLAMAIVCAFDVDTFLLDALVSFKTSVLEEVRAMCVISTLLWNTFGRFAK